MKTTPTDDNLPGAEPREELVNSKVSIGTAITLCLAIAAGSWALSTEVHNYRLQDISTTIEAQTNLIMTGIEDRNQIWRAIDTLVTVSAMRGDDVAEIKGLLKSAQ